MLPGAPGANRKPAFLCDSGRVHPNPIFQQAYAFTKGPTPQKLGFIYMLRGDNGASNTDPYATEEKPDNNWVTTGSHVMIVGADAKALLQAYPRDPKPDPHKPYVMWAGSPYEHLMLPVQ